MGDDFLLRLPPIRLADTQIPSRSPGHNPIIIGGHHKTPSAANPQIIPRNHRLEAMIEAAVAGDMVPFERLMQALGTPFDVPPAFDDLRRPPTAAEIVPATFCGT